MKRQYISNIVLAGEQVDVGDLNPVDYVDPSATIPAGSALQFYTVAHEGQIQPQIFTRGRYVKHLLQVGPAALRNIYSYLTPGLKCVANHDKSKGLSLSGRDTVAQVVGRLNHKIDDVWHTLAVLCFNDPSQIANFPSLSLESKGFRVKDRVVAFVDRLTSLALLTKEFTPAFENAHRRGSPVFCAYSPDIPDGEDMDSFTNHNQTQRRKRKMDVESVSTQELVNELKRRQLRPSMAFDSHEVFGNVEVQEGQLRFNGGDNQFTRTLDRLLNGYSIVKEDEYKTLQASAKEWEDKKDRLEKAESENLRRTATDKIPELAKAMGMGDNFVKFASREDELKKLTSSGNPEKDVQDYVSQVAQNYKALQEQGFIAKDDTQTEPGEGGGSAPASPPQEGQNAPAGGQLKQSPSTGANGNGGFYDQPINPVTN